MKIMDCAGNEEPNVNTPNPPLPDPTKDGMKMDCAGNEEPNVSVPNISLSHQYRMADFF